MDYQSFQPGGQEQNQNQAPIPPPQQLVAPKKFMPKLIGLIVLLLVLGGGAVYAGIWYWQNQQIAQEVAPTFTPRPSSSAMLDTSTWKTFTNTKYGYEFKYPDNFIFQEIFNDTSNNWYKFAIKSSNGDALTFEINNPGIGFGPLTLEQQQNIANTPPLYINGITMIAINGGYAFKKGNDGFIVYVNSNSKDSVVLNQILSTFKFTNSVDTSTWKTYTNSKYGYQFNYPPAWNAITSQYESGTAIFGPGATSGSGIGGVEKMGQLSIGQNLKTFVNLFNKGVESGSTSETQSVINGQAVIISILPKAGGGYVESVAFLHGTDVFSVYLTDYAKWNASGQFDQILSTFKFIP